MPYRYLLFAVLVLLAALAFNRLGSHQQSVPALNFTDIDGQPHSFQDYQGKPLLVVFWATDCPGCIKEIPQLIRLYHQYHPQGLEMVAIAMPHDTLAHIHALRKQRRLPYTITWDKTGELTAAFDQVRVTPTHFLIHPQGRIIMRKIGELDIEYLEQKLAEMGLSRG